MLDGSLSSVFLAVLFTLYAYGMCLAFLCSFFNLFKNYKPYCVNGEWFNAEKMGGWYIGEIERNLFPEVTFENSPQIVRFELVKEEEVL